MDLNDVEAIDFNALGGADTIVVNDLSGTDVTRVANNLSAGGGGDGQPDTVVVNGTNGDDVVLVTGDAASTSVVGLSAQVDMTGAEAANDRITVNALAGDDVVEASGLQAGAIQLTADGGQGDDVLIGGDGNDVLWVVPATTCSSVAAVPTSSTAATATTSRSSSSPPVRINGPRRVVTG